MLDADKQWWGQHPLSCRTQNQHGLTCPRKKVSALLPLQIKEIYVIKSYYSRRIIIIIIIAAANNYWARFAKLVTCTISPDPHTNPRGKYYYDAQFSDERNRDSQKLRNSCYGTIKWPNRIRDQTDFETRASSCFTGVCYQRAVTHSKHLSWTNYTISLGLSFLFCKSRDRDNVYSEILYMLGLIPVCKD